MRFYVMRHYVVVKWTKVQFWYTYCWDGRKRVQRNHSDSKNFDFVNRASPGVYGFSSKPGYFFRYGPHDLNLLNESIYLCR